MSYVPPNYVLVGYDKEGKLAERTEVTGPGALDSMVGYFSKKYPRTDIYRVRHDDGTLVLLTVPK